MGLSHRNSVRLLIAFRCSPCEQLEGQLHKATPEYVREHNTIEQWLEVRRGRITEMVRRGWSEAGAEVYMALSGRGAPIAKALRERRDTYSASTYALCEALYEAARTQTDAYNDMTSANRFDKVAYHFDQLRAEAGMIIIKSRVQRRLASFTKVHMPTCTRATRAVERPRDLLVWAL